MPISCKTYNMYTVTKFRLGHKSQGSVIVDDGLNTQVGRYSPLETGIGYSYSVESYRTDNGERLDVLIMTY